MTDFVNGRCTGCGRHWEMGAAHFCPGTLPAEAFNQSLERAHEVKEEDIFPPLEEDVLELDRKKVDAAQEQLRLYGTPPPHEAVNHPAHYQTDDGGKECIEVIEEYGLGFHLGNAIKYLMRSGRKGDEKQEMEDLKKARWYVRRYFELTKVDPCRPNQMK